MDFKNKLKEYQTIVEKELDIDRGNIQWKNILPEKMKN